MKLELVITIVGMAVAIGIAFGGVQYATSEGRAEAKEIRAKQDQLTAAVVKLTQAVSSLESSAQQQNALAGEVRALHRSQQRVEFAIAVLCKEITGDFTACYPTD